MTPILLLVSAVLGIAGDLAARSAIFTAAFPDLALANCSQYTDCAQCYNASYLCHWCSSTSLSSPISQLEMTRVAPEGSCHAKFSTDGCTVGASCEGDQCSSRTSCSTCVGSSSGLSSGHVITPGSSTAATSCKWCGSSKKCVAQYNWECVFSSRCFLEPECVRSEPEYVGHVVNTPFTVKLLSLVFIILIYSCCGSNAVSLWWRLRKGSQGVTSPPSGGTSSENTPMLPSDSTSQNVVRPRRGLVRSFFLWVAVYLAAATTVLSSLFVLGVVALWPSIPEVSVCNADVTMKDVLDSVIQSLTERNTVQSEILISVYNPSYFHVFVNEFKGQLTYKDMPVATVSLTDLDAREGSVSDSLGSLQFSGFDQAPQMIYDYEWNGRLQMTMQGVMSFKVTLFSIDILDMSTTLPPYPVDAKKGGTYNKHCKCAPGAY